MANLRLLHTSDWHLGRRLYGHTRYEEFSAFLDWLYNCIVEQSIDVLIVAGDIFDSMTPSNKAQALYYEFLGRVSHSSCQHVIIVAGNHDSPSLLDAP
ncbi:MAG: exonuclease sbcCD subunit D, partial [Pseudomonadales bacterium]